MGCCGKKTNVPRPLITRCPKCGTSFVDLLKKHKVNKTPETQVVVVLICSKCAKKTRVTIR